MWQPVIDSLVGSDSYTRIIRISFFNHTSNYTSQPAYFFLSKNHNWLNLSIIEEIKIKSKKKKLSSEKIWTTDGIAGMQIAKKSAISIEFHRSMIQTTRYIQAFVIQVLRMRVNLLDFDFLLCFC